jgi:hypothetical protein
MQGTHDRASTKDSAIEVMATAMSRNKKQSMRGTGTGKQILLSSDYPPHSSLMNVTSSMSLDSYVENMLRHMFVYAANGARSSAMLDETILKARSKVTIGIFQSTRSISVLLTRRPFQLYLFAMGAIVLGGSTYTIIRTNKKPTPGMFEGRFFRFKIAGAQSIPAVYDVNLLRQGCPLGEPSKKSKQGSTYWIDYGKTVSANGWMFATMDLATKTSPVVFSLEACSMNTDTGDRRKELAENMLRKKFYNAEQNENSRRDPVWSETPKDMDTAGWNSENSAMPRAGTCRQVGGTEWQHKNDGSVYVSSEREYYQTAQQESSQGEYNQPGQEHRQFFFDYSVRYTKNLVQTAALVFGLASLLAAPLAAFKVRSAGCICNLMILYLYLTLRKYGCLRAFISSEARNRNRINLLVNRHVKSSCNEYVFANRHVNPSGKEYVFVNWHLESSGKYILRLELSLPVCLGFWHVFTTVNLLAILVCRRLTKIM